MNIQVELNVKKQSEDNTGGNDIVSRCDLDNLLKEFVTKRRPHSFVQHSLYFHSFGPASHGTAGMAESTRHMIVILGWKSIKDSYDSFASRVSSCPTSPARHRVDDS